MVYKFFFRFLPSVKCWLLAAGWWLLSAMWWLVAGGCCISVHVLAD
jgi:hypothetical protein